MIKRMLVCLFTLLWAIYFPVDVVVAASNTLSQKSRDCVQNHGRNDVRYYMGKCRTLAAIRQMKTKHRNCMQERGAHFRWFAGECREKSKIESYLRNKACADKYGKDWRYFEGNCKTIVEINCLRQGKVYSSGLGGEQGLCADRAELEEHKRLVASAIVAARAACENQGKLLGTPTEIWKGKIDYECVEKPVAEEPVEETPTEETTERSDLGPTYLNCEVGKCAVPWANCREGEGRRCWECQLAWNPNCPGGRIRCNDPRCDEPRGR